MQLHILCFYYKKVLFTTFLHFMFLCFLVLDYKHLNISLSTFYIFSIPLSYFLLILTMITNFNIKIFSKPITQENVYLIK